jgi:hypothetical protein
MIFDCGTAAPRFCCLRIAPAHSIDHVDGVCFSNGIDDVVIALTGYRLIGDEQRLGVDLVIQCDRMQQAETRGFDVCRR